MRFALSLALGALLPASIALAETPLPSKYTMEDLRALGQSQSWAELLEHVEDVRPSERKGEWSGLLEKAAVGYLETFAAQKKYAEAQMGADSLLSRFPALKQAKSFMAKRTEVGLASLGQCFRDPYAAAQCVEAVDAFTKVDPTDLELAFRGAKLIVDVGRMRAPATPLFARSLGDKKQRAARCKDGSLKEAALEAFGHPPEYASTKAAHAIAFEHCYVELMPALLEAFYASGGYGAENLCRGLTEKKAKLTPFQSALCKDKLAKGS